MVSFDNELLMLEVRSTFIHSKYYCHTLLFICWQSLIPSTNRLTKKCYMMTFLHQDSPKPHITSISFQHKLLLKIWNSQHRSIDQGSLQSKKYLLTSTCP